MEQAKLASIVLVLTLISGFADSQGFVHASRIWGPEKVCWAEVVKSGLSFAVGILVYWASLKYLTMVGVVAPEIQTVIWFGVTLVGVAVTSGAFLRWKLSEQVVAVLVLVAIAWLMARTKS